MMPDELPHHLDPYLAELQRQGKSAHTLAAYRRDLQQYREGNSERAPYLPEHYLTPAGIRLANAYLASGAPISDFPEAALLEEVDVTWRDTAKALFANWLGLVYQLTHQDRRLQFMDGIDPADPLGRLKKR